MKKVLAVIGVAILMAAFAVPASAQFKTYGSMQITGKWVEKQDFNTGLRPGDRIPGSYGQDADLTYKNVWQRFNFFLEYGDPKTVRAVIGFEADSTDWGESSTVQAAQVPGGNDFMGSKNTDKASLGIKVAFIEFMVPNSPLQVTAGIQNFNYGGRLVESQDAMGVSVAALFAPHKITAMWYRINDDPLWGGGSYTTGNYSGRLAYHVNDFYAVKYDLIQKAFNAQVYFVYNNDLYSGYSGTGGAAPGGWLGNGVDHPYWVGARATFMPGNWTIYGQFAYKGGKREYDNPALSELKYSAYAMELEVKYKIGPGMYVIGEGYYATGNDANSSDKSKMYTVPNGSEAQSNFGLHKTVFFWMNFNEFDAQHQKDQSIGGKYYLRAAFEYAPVEWLNLILNYLYIGDTSKGNANGTVQVNSGYADQWADEDFHGHEINLLAQLKIYESLMLYTGIGMFLPGDVYKNRSPSLSSPKEPETAYAAAVKLLYAF